MNFDELTKKFKKLGKDTVTEVQKLNEIRQLSSKVSDEKKKVNTLYMEMGKKLYDLYKDAPLEGFESEILSVTEKFTMMDLLQDQIREVKGVTLCPCCNMEVGMGERFCSNCGNRMPELVTEGAEEETAEEVVEAEVVEVEDAAETDAVCEENTEEVVETEAEVSE